MSYLESVETKNQSPRFEVLFSPLEDGDKYVDKVFEFGLLLVSICLFYFTMLVQLTILLCLRLYSNNENQSGIETWITKWSSGPTISLKYMFYQFSIDDLSNGIIMGIVILLSSLSVYILLSKTIFDSVEVRRRNVFGLFIVHFSGVCFVDGVHTETLANALLYFIISLAILLKSSFNDEVCKRTTKKTSILPITNNDNDEVSFLR